MNDDEVQRATDILLTGGVVAHACEGVWGLACDAYSFASVQRILELKLGPIQNGLILIGDQAAEFSVELMGLNEEQREEVVNSWPGPETWKIGDAPISGVDNGGSGDGGRSCSRSRTSSRDGTSVRGSARLNLSESIG
ncbi:MAG: hypothetical protein Ct9H300mP8_08330 [Gammaproteobacteria bacterium]|nr:MAG: hypothetical protein Ct9H300mP8_08330 [Gammaproteobacteria bacterium]